MMKKEKISKFEYNKINELKYLDADLIIQVCDKKFLVHSYILIKKSSYFKIALSNNWAKKDGEKYFFKKPNFSPKIFDVILE